MYVNRAEVKHAHENIPARAIHTNEELKKDIATDKNGQESDYFPFASCFSPVFYISVLKIATISTSIF